MYHEEFNLIDAIRAEAREKSQAGQSWKSVFFRSFRSANIDATRLSEILNLPKNDQSLKRAVKTEGRAGLRPDQQRRIIGRQL